MNFVFGWVTTLKTRIYGCLIRWISRFTRHHSKNARIYDCLIWWISRWKNTTLKYVYICLLNEAPPWTVARSEQMLKAMVPCMLRKKRFKMRAERANAKSDGTMHTKKKNDFKCVRSEQMPKAICAPHPKTAPCTTQAPYLAVNRLTMREMTN